MIDNQSQGADDLLFGINQRPLVTEPENIAR
jgi:hypothetical protein